MRFTRGSVRRGAVRSVGVVTGLTGLVTGMMVAPAAADATAAASAVTPTFATTTTASAIAETPTNATTTSATTTSATPVIDTVPATGAGNADAAHSGTVRLTGVLRQVIADDFKHHREGRLASVTTDDGEILPVPASLTTGLGIGARVTVTITAPQSARSGRALRAALSHGLAGVRWVTPVAPGIQSHGTRSRPVQSDAARAGAGRGGSLNLSYGSGRHQVIVVPLYWETTKVPQGQPTPAELKDAVASADTYWRTNTGGKVGFTATKVLPWQRVPALKGTTCERVYDIEAKARALAGTVPDDGYHHVVAYLPGLGSGCSWAGLGYINGDFVWINSTLDTKVWAHEFGHNLGLSHSGALECSENSSTGGRYVPLSDDCRGVPYSDPYDIMGAMYGLGHISASHLDDLGLLPESAVTSVNGSATVSLAPVAGEKGVRLIRIPFGRDLMTVEYRAAVGADAWINTDPYAEAAPRDGVIVRVQRLDPSNPDFLDQDVVNKAPFTTWSGMRPGLHAGEQVSYRGVRVTVRSIAGGIATVSVTGTKDASAPTAASITGYADGTVVPGMLPYFVLEGGVDDQTRTTNIDVLTDGVVTQRLLPGRFTNPGLLLAPGKHSYRLRARNGAGLESTGPARSLVRDTSAPVITAAPVALLTGGTMTASAAPVKVAWAAHDELDEVASTRLTRVPAFKANLGWKARSLVTTGVGSATGTSNSWAVRVYDYSGNNAYRSGPVQPLVIDPLLQRSRSVARRWADRKDAASIGGSEWLTAGKGASASWSVTARSVAIVSASGPTRGAFALYIDGKLNRIVSEYSRRTHPRQVVWFGAWRRVGKHSLQIVNLGTRGRPTVGVDALARLG